ncbi:MAG: SPOR domain-containing protein [Flavobacterium sp.]|nr:SPOR domain-containing protein [Flavobacterium sp.]
MLLDKYISDLLYRYQCVTVPNFGAFVTENQSAKVSGSASTFLPPRKVISFNVNIKNNDGLLANHIALQENISYDKALESINYQVNIWVLALENRDRVVLHNIGEIFVNGEYNWIFKPFETVNYLVSSFGLSTFVAPEMKREQLLKQVEAFDVKEPILLVPQKKKTYSFIKYAAAITLLLGAGTAAYKIQHDQQVATDTLLVQKEVQREVQQSIQEATFFIGSPSVSVELPVKEEIMPYHVIAGAFRSEKNAEKALKMLLEEGYKAHILEKNRQGLTPVVYGSYKTIEEAEAEIKNLNKEEDTGAWLLID